MQSLSYSAFRLLYVGLAFLILLVSVHNTRWAMKLRSIPFSFHRAKEPVQGVPLATSAFLYSIAVQSEGL